MGLPLQVRDPDSGEQIALGERGFVGRGERRVLRYPVGASGWTDHLTALHEAHDADGKHYIDVASRKYAVSEVRRTLAGRSHATALEVGVSSGHFLRDLRAAMPDLRLLGADYTDSKLDALAAELPDVAFFQFDLTRCPLPDNAVDAIVALNVLEHIEDDAAAAQQIARILAPDGAAIIEVPAGPELFDDFDRQLMHFRRYRMPELVEKFTRAGLTIERRSHLGFLLFPAFWAAKHLSKAKPAADASSGDQKAASMMTASRFIGPIGRAIMTTEAALRACVPLPFGIRCLITARKAP